jgi:hypothetical protein
MTFFFGQREYSVLIYLFLASNKTRGKTLDVVSGRIKKEFVEFFSLFLHLFMLLSRINR